MKVAITAKGGDLLSEVDPRFGRAAHIIIIDSATLEFEGTMTHPGMMPVFADASETSAGRYEATLEFTMGGDWIIIVRGALPDGSELEREIEVRGVQVG